MRLRTTISELMCMSCGGKFPIARKSHQLKRKNHIKDLWCINCKKVTKHVEKLVAHTVRRDLFISANSKEGIKDDDTDWEKLFGIDS